MVDFRAYDRVRLDHLLELGTLADTGPADIHSRTSSGLIVTQGNVNFILKGNGIQYWSGFPIAGTITSLKIVIDRHPSYQFAKFAFSVPQILAILDKDNPRAVASAFLAGNDTIIGSPFDDVLPGFGGKDLIRGMKGDDRLEGGKGNDRLEGGDGRDVLKGGAGRDLLDGGAKTDTADYSDKTVSVKLILDGADWAKVRVGSRDEDKVRAIESVRGGSGDDRLTGDAKANTLKGGAGNDVLKGQGGSDILEGGKGADDLVGGPGNDRLTGGPGNDRFIFAAALDANTNVDRVTDFGNGADIIVLARSVFSVLAAGALAAASFVAGTDAADADDFIIYDQPTGKLFYDRDGFGDTDKVLFARLNAGTAFDETDILVV